MCTTPTRKRLKRREISRFHSLQTGKHMCTFHSHADLGPRSSPCFVSIPFKRESTCALELAEDAEIKSGALGFHSLQTGKHMCTNQRRNNVIVSRPGFHSLQTGKHMCTHRRIGQRHVSENVSIPFKRESTCARTWLRERILRFKFPFPSNGKAHVHSEDRIPMGTTSFVSIPFKRESTCAHTCRRKKIPGSEKSFHSLQTGKHMCTEIFKAMQASELGFHSLQTGKHMCTEQQQQKNA